LREDNAWEGPKLKLVEVAETVLDKSCGERHGVEPSTNEKTSSPIRYNFVYIR
jgi:hypothetical protein